MLLGNIGNYFSSVEITDAQGRLLKELKIEAEEESLRISTEDLADGIYMLRLLDEKNKNLVLKKLAVQH